jgi:arabinofuranosyltransferase
LVIDPAIAIGKTTHMQTNNRSHFDKRALTLVLFVSSIFYFFFIYRTRFVIDGVTFFTLIDDAMISMRYAMNFADGAGLTWNNNEPLIQGFTNLGWTLYMSIFHSLGVSYDKISLAIMLTSVLFLLGTVYITFQACKKISPNSQMAPLIAATITAFYFPLVFWSLRGMEVGALTFLTYLAVYKALDPSKPYTLKNAALLGSILSLAVLTRIDATLSACLILAYACVTHYKNNGRLIHFSPAIIIAGLTILGILSFQYLYYGSLQPNTYYLKVNGVSLAERLLLGIQVFFQYAVKDIAPPLIILFFGFFYSLFPRNLSSLLLFALFITQCAYSVYVGGDYAEPLKGPQVDAANRFITQAMPSLFILSALSIEKLITILRTRESQPFELANRHVYTSASCVSLLLVLAISGSPWLKWTIHNAPLLDSDIWRTKLGLHIKQSTNSDAVIAVHAAGQIPYYSQRKTIDLLGKSDSYIAREKPRAAFRPGHNKWNYYYSINKLQPDLVADEWGKLRHFLANRSSYKRLRNGIHIQSDSERINLIKISKNYR